VQPTLSWSVANAASVQVSGPGFSSSASSGSASVCPGTPAGAACVGTSGSSATYTVRGLDPSGVIVFESSATFTVG
jgi:hypothetical protein